MRSTNSCNRSAINSAYTNTSSKQLQLCGSQVLLSGSSRFASELRIVQKDVTKLGVARKG